MLFNAGICTVSKGLSFFHKKALNNLSQLSSSFMYTATNVLYDPTGPVCMGRVHTQVKKDPRQLSEKGVLSTACFAFTLTLCPLHS